jgi:thiopeptide-type bacteriocin biosynthesis protein
VRFAGAPPRLLGELLPELHDALGAASERGLVWKVALDTYEREVERYGGPEGIELAEAVFHADSDCVLGTLGLVSRLDGDAGGDAAWRLALVGIDRLMDDLGFALDDKLAAMTTAAAAYGAEVGADTALHKQLGDKFRAHRTEIAALLDGPGDDHRFAPALAMFAARSARLRPIGHQLRAQAAAGRLGQPVTELVHSYLHMHVNRMIRSAQRLHEVVLYDLLRRHYEGIVARRRQLARAS